MKKGGKLIVKLNEKDVTVVFTRDTEMSPVRFKLLGPTILHQEVLDEVRSNHQDHYTKVLQSTSLVLHF